MILRPGSPRLAGKKWAIGALLASGLAFYIWTAVTAPIVLWSDSRVALRWARQGVGIWNSLSSADTRELHPLKPGYLIFLRLAGRSVGNASPLRTIVVLQSLLLWTSIAGASALVARGKGLRSGVLAYAVLILFLPIRDSASAIMSEALAGALLLTLAAFALFPPRRFRGEVAIAPALMGLYEFRPNVGAMAFILLVAGWSFQGRFLSAARTAAAFGAGMVVVMVLQNQAGIRDFHRSVPILLHFGSAEYYWSPSLRQWPDGSGPMAGGTDLLPLNPTRPQVRPIVSVSLPQSILDENRLRPIALKVVSTGIFDASSYLIFPVVPPPWRPRARRLGSPSLSPASDVQTGSLDWWAHSGRDDPREEAPGQSSTLRQP